MAESGDDLGSRLTPDDRIPEERRSEARRREDVVRIDALRRRYASYRRTAIVAVVAWAVVATVAAIALLFAAANANTAASKATKALRKVNAEQAAVAAAEQRLTDATLGACYRLNYLRWQDDKARYAGWVRDRNAASYLEATVRYVRQHGTLLQQRSVLITTALAANFRNAATSAYFLPLTDCTAADDHPRTYRPPNAIPFERVRRAHLTAILAMPPQPPAYSRP